MTYEAKARQDISKGRHHLLKLGSDHNAVFMWLRDNPDSTSDQIRDATQIPHPQAMARITELKNAGLIIETGETRLTKAGRPAKVLRTVRENETGHGRDEVALRFTIFRNEYGEYSFDAVLIGELPSARHNNPAAVVTKTIHMHVPKPTEPPMTRQFFDPDMRPREDIRPSRKPVIIDSEVVKE